MIPSTLEQELLEYLHNLAPEQQRQVVEFARTLAVAQVRGVPGHTLLRFAGAITPEDLAAMARTIEEDCEQVSLDEW